VLAVGFLGQLKILTSIVHANNLDRLTLLFLLVHLQAGGFYHPILCLKEIQNLSPVYSQTMRRQLQLVTVTSRFFGSLILDKSKKMWLFGSVFLLLVLDFKTLFCFALATAQASQAFKIPRSILYPRALVTCLHLASLMYPYLQWALWIAIVFFNTVLLAAASWAFLRQWRHCKQHSSWSRHCSIEYLDWSWWEYQTS